MKARVLVAGGTTEFASVFAPARESARETFATTVSPPNNTTTQASIIILSYNSRAWLETLLPSLSQTRGSYEVIVADNNSTDGSVEFVAARHPDVRLIRNDGNLGYAAGNNRAATYARADQLV